jgi:hypothetical protein
MLPSGIGRVREDWSFEARGLTDRRFFRAVAPGGWHLKSVTVNGVDVTDSGVECTAGEDLSGVEIVLSRAMGSLSGTVLDASGKVATDYTVVVFAADARLWTAPTRFVRAARPDTSGTFLLNGLPRGDYLVTAVDYLEPGEEGNPALLEELRTSAARVSIADGEARTLSLTLRR